jgi:heme-degrading monooxygenase HmoA
VTYRLFRRCAIERRGAAADIRDTAALRSASLCAARADLDRIDGFISIERFHSLSDPEKLLSLSF